MVFSGRLTDMHRYLLLPVAIVLAGAVACSSEDEAARPTRSAEVPHTLADTFHYLRACREDRAYLELGQYVAPESRDKTVALLQAMDALMVANEAALQIIQTNCPDIDLRQYDMSFLADLLDIFSRSAKLISSDHQGQQGTVTYEVDRRAAPAKAVFRKEGGHWVYVPGRQDEMMILHLREAADALVRVARRWEKTPVTAREIHNTYATRILPELRQAASTASGNGTPPPSTQSSERVTDAGDAAAN